MVIFLFITSCISHYEYQTKNSYNQNLFYTLSIKQNKYVLRRTEDNYFNINYGDLIKESESVFILKEIHNEDSMDYFVEYLYKKGSFNNFTLLIDSRVPFQKILINDTVFLDSVFSPVVNSPQYHTFIIPQKPLSVKLESCEYPDMIFNRDFSTIKSKQYMVPDTCNYMKIVDNPAIENTLGTVLKFNKKTGELFSKANKMYLIKVSRPALKSINKSHRIRLKELIRNTR